MSSLLAPTGPTALDWAGDLLAEAWRERLWAWSDPEIIDRVAAGL